MKIRIEEIKNNMKSFGKELFSKEELLPELLALQTDLVSATFNGDHAEKGKLRILDVEKHLESLNAECGNIADEQLEKFKQDCKVICNTIKGEKSGLSGEQKAFKSLDTLRCKHKILKNIEFTLGDHRTELDAIVLTEKAAFIIEVKNTMKNIVIDERGNYCRVRDDALIFDKNIGEKMNEKEYLLREAFKTAGLDNIEIASLVVFTNSSVNVDNKYPYIKTCYLSDMPHIIGGYNKQRVYSDENIDQMVDAIESGKCHEAYPTPIDMKEFKNDFATLMVTLEEAKESIDNKSSTQKSNSKMKWMKQHSALSHLAASIVIATITSVAVFTTSLVRK